MSNGREISKRAVFHIRVKGVLDSKWADWFDDMTMTSLSNGQTLLTGPVADQPALLGLLAKVTDLGLTLLSVEREGNALPAREEIASQEEKP